MARHVYYSLHYAADRARAELVRNISLLTPNQEATPAAWATLQRTGEFAIKRWFEQQLRGRSCTVVLIGAETAHRPLVLYELRRSWELKLGVLGIYIHGLKDAQGKVAEKGANPFEQPGLEALASIAQTYDPPGDDSKLVYRHIADHIVDWVELAVAERARHPS